MKTYKKEHICKSCGEQSEEIQHTLECYQGDKVYEETKARINISIGIATNNLTKRQEPNNYINQFQKMLELIKIMIMI